MNRKLKITCTFVPCSVAQNRKKVKGGGGRDYENTRKGGMISDEATWEGGNKMQKTTLKRKRKSGKCSRMRCFSSPVLIDY